MSKYSAETFISQSGVSAATEPQRKFIYDLIGQVYEENQAVAYLISVGRMVETGALTRRRASEMIENLKELRAAKPKAALAKPNPAVRTDGIDLRSLIGGRYAVRDGDKVRFLRVRKVEDDKSKWDGWVFVDEQASDDYHGVGRQAANEPVYDGKYLKLLKEIAADEAAAFALYGQEIGSCGVCGRTLTDEASRERGIGPVCHEKIGGVL